MKLGVNIDHIAVLREARKINDPNPLNAVPICELAGADQITVHLREDRRHIQDNDIIDIIRLSSLPVNLECAVAPEIINIVCSLKPHRATIVPEKRAEVTTEGGLALEDNFNTIKDAILKLQENDIEVSLFIDPSIKNVELSKDLGVQWVEFHTGRYANIYAMLYGGLANSHHSIKSLDLPRNELEIMLSNELECIKDVTKLASSINLKVAAGHGLNYHNVKQIAQIEQIEELNIGQSIIARSIFTGLEKAIKDMIECIK
ncbi:MAG: pyridoxine 5-phosphate synthase [Sulfurovum sp. AS07-7]|nr:MAG: pyridoxine 5-phosphate synthase [Sulfurovum sp. AS07-7]